MKRTTWSVSALLGFGILLSFVQVSPAPPIPASVRYWANYPAIGDIDMNNKAVSNVPAIVFSDGSTMMTEGSNLYWRSSVGSSNLEWQLDGPSQSEFRSLQNEVTAMYSYGTRLDFTELNTALNAFRIQINGSLAVTPMADGYSDEFEDTSGVNATVSSNITHDAGNAKYTWSAQEDIDFSGLLMNYEMADNAANSAVVNSNGPAANGVLYTNFGHALKAETLTSLYQLGGGAVPSGLAGGLHMSNNVTAVILAGSYTSTPIQTVSFWFRTAYKPSDEQLAVRMGTSTNAVCEAQYGISHNLINGKYNTVYIRPMVFKSGSSALQTPAWTYGGDAVQANKGEADGNWHHFVGVWSATNFLVWLDGIKTPNGNPTTPNPEGSGHFTSRVVVAAGPPIYIGSNPLGSFDWQGDIAQFRVENRAYSETEIAWLYNSGNGRQAVTGRSGPGVLVGADYTMTGIVPDQGKLIMLMEDAGIPGTDYTAYVSRNGGANWDQVTPLTDFGTFASGVNIIESGVNTNLTGTGSNFIWKVISDGSQGGSIHGIAIQGRE